MSDTTGNALALPKETATESTSPAHSPQRLPDGRFAPGNLGNPQGRPRGSRNRATIAVESLMEGEA